MASNLPYETLFEIFSGVQSTFPEGWVWRGGDTGRVYLVTVSNGPWALGQVCRMWRNVVITSSSLWSIILFKHLGPETPVNAPFKAQAAATWSILEGLRRSGKKTLSISAVDGPLGTYFPLLLTAACSWETIDTSTNVYFPPRSRTWTNLREATFGKLQYLALSFINGSSSRDFLSVLSERLRCAPLLHSVHLHRYHNSYPLDLPWNQLTRLTLQSCFTGLAHVLFFLRACPRLLYFADDQTHSTTDVLANQNIVHMLELETLDQSSTVLGKYLLCPALKIHRVTLGALNVPGSPAIEELFDFWSRSECPLQEIKFVDSRKHHFQTRFSSSVVQSLQQLHTLTHSSTTFLQYIQCPNLKTHSIELRGFSFADISSFWFRSNCHLEGLGISFPCEGQGSYLHISPPPVHILIQATATFNLSLTSLSLQLAFEPNREFLALFLQSLTIVDPSAGNISSYYFPSLTRLRIVLVAPRFPYDQIRILVNEPLFGMLWSRRQAESLKICGVATLQAISLEVTPSPSRLALEVFWPYLSCSGSLWQWVSEGMEVFILARGSFFFFSPRFFAEVKLRLFSLQKSAR
jgi:hypothetical protein